MRFVRCWDEFATIFAENCFVMSQRRAVKGGGQREGDQPPNPVQNYRGVREIENVLLVVKTSKLEMRQNMLPF